MPAPYDIEAILRHYGKGDISRIEEDEGAWDASGNKITLDDAAITAARAAINAENAARTHQFPRSQEYPPIGDQLDDLFHKGAFSAEMTAKLQAVKDAYPKP